MMVSLLLGQMRFILCGIAAGALLFSSSVGGVAAAEGTIEFNRDIRPILSDACLSCHGPDSASRQAGLRLDQRDAAIDFGAIVVGDPESSEIVRRVLSDDPAEVMPPPSAKKPLSEEQKSLLAEWIKAGAEYEPHWSFIAPTRPELPAVKNPNWGRNPIDRFIAARLDEANLTPAPEADRRTLARRVSLDITGLPPEPEVVEQFVKDDSPDAYEKLIDCLMESPAWGQHRGRYWLDYARYGDTHGIHFDNYREIWSYREWVIDAYNRNMPFDEFTIENLAGDLLPNATLQQQIGSGFNRCNITTNEGGVIAEEYKVLYARDRTDTTAQVWMGLTAGCAVCHDHKFDPLSQREFYELSAFFNNTTQPVMDGNVKDTPPVVVVPLQPDRKRWEELPGLIQNAIARITEREKSARPEFEAWLSEVDPQEIAARTPQDNLQFAAPLNDGGDTLAVVEDGAAKSTSRIGEAQWRPGKLSPQALYIESGEVLQSPHAGDFEHDQSFSFAAWVKLPANDSSGAIFARMDDANGFRGWDLYNEGRRVGAHIINHWPENALKVLTRDQIPADQWVHVAVTYDGSKQAAGVKVFVNGKEQATAASADKLTDTIHTDVAFKVGQRQNGSKVSGVTIEDVRIYQCRLDPGQAASLANAPRFSALAAQPAEARDGAELNEMFRWWLLDSDDVHRQLSDDREGLLREQEEIKGRATVAHVMHEQDEAAKAYVLFRGEYDQRREEVSPGVPAVLPDFPEGAERNRLGLAQWLLTPEHPLTARVTVNRYWQEVFGRGLVRTAGDFGVAGELPSHPELLDWLAVEFRESGWDVKKLFKLMLTSAAYRQSAVVTAEKLERDPANRLLSRGPRFRMAGEMVRDSALAASGLLVDKIGGPSVRPYQPEGVWEAVAMIGSDTRDYTRGTGEDLYRRSMYTFWKRSAPPASMEIFDAPSREYCVVTRDRTNTPLQALVTLNDTQFVEAARVLAGRAILEGGDSFEDRLQFISLRLVSREFGPAESEHVRKSFERLAGYYEQNPSDADKLIQVGESTPSDEIEACELASWTMLVNELMNLDEVVNK